MHFSKYSIEPADLSISHDAVIVFTENAHMLVVSLNVVTGPPQHWEYAAVRFEDPRKGKRAKGKGKKALSRRDRSPCPRLTPPSLCGVLVLSPEKCEWRVDVPSSFFSSSAGAASPPDAAAPPAPPAAGAAAAPPPEPTFRSRSLTSLPSRACRVSETASRVISLGRAHLGEESCPDGLDLVNLCGLDERLELVGLAQLATMPTPAPRVFIQ
jgi:hypothetical protein